MSNYENGATTRQAIVQACKQLFYEQGFHETSYGDICKAAHVNRGTIYYHFKDKEAMRYEVQWEYIIANRRIVEKYCSDKRYHYILAMCMYWIQVHRDGHMRQFSLQCCRDVPVYTGKKDLSFFYYAGYETMWGDFWDKTNISQLAFASVYGYIMSCMRLLCEHPEKYDPMEMYEHCVNASVAIWGIPQEIMDAIWKDVKHYISLIPEEEMQVRLS